MKQYKLDFEKFVEDIEKRNKQREDKYKKLQEQEEENFARKLALLYRELPQNSVYYGRHRDDKKRYR